METNNNADKEKVKDSFVVFADWFGMVSLMSDEEAGKLLKAMFLHNNCIDNKAIITELSITDKLKYPMEIIFKKMDDNKVKWIEKCKKNRENSNLPPKNPEAKRGRPPKKDQHKQGE